MTVYTTPDTLKVLIVCDTAQAAEATVADMVADTIAANPHAALGLATGRSMLGVYALLLERYRDGQIAFDGLSSFNLDEYSDLPSAHPASFSSYMRRHLFDHVAMRPGSWHLPDGSGTDQTNAAFEQAIRDAGGIKLQLLGIGRNGHIGFNEPGCSPDSRTRRVELSASTRTANASDFPAGEQVPHHAVTMGIATILDAERIVLLATGAAKTEALAQAFLHPVSSACPASFLQNHSNVTVVCDAAAALHFEASL